MIADLVVRARRVVLAAGRDAQRSGAGPDGGDAQRSGAGPDGTVPAAVVVRDGRIVDVTAVDDAPAAREVVDLAADEVLLPGLVDSHVHVDDPGRAHWEGFPTATAAAAAGGITTLVDMPLNSLPPTVDAGALATKRDAARGRLAVDVAFWGGAVPLSAAGEPDPAGAVDPDRMAALVADGVVGFKCFLTDSGVPEFPPVSPADLERAARACAELGVPLVVHAEDDATLAAAPPARADYAGFLASRPVDAELAAVRRVLDVAAATGARMHVLHVSAAAAAHAVADAREAGLAVSCETCPHYLSLTAETLTATSGKCCPPVREGANRERLWEALAAGRVDAVVSDHSPCPPELKAGGFDTAWGGISSLEIALRVVWTEASARGLGLGDVVRWMSAAPAALAGLGAKGAIAVGRDADLVAFAPDARAVVDPARLHHRHPVTPYAGAELRGAVRRVWLRGAAPGAGAMLVPSRSQEAPR